MDLNKECEGRIQKAEQNNAARISGRETWKTVSSVAETLIFENFIWLNTKEAAEYLRTQPKQLRKWVYQGRVKAYRLLGKSLRFKKTELDLLIEGGRKWE